MKEAVGGFARLVPGPIAEGGARDRTGGRRRRTDGPSGKRVVELLRQVPLFSGLSRRHLRRLSEHADEMTYRQREAIVLAGRPGGTFYAIAEGEAKVVRNGRTISRLGPGEFFGEISLLDGGPRTASVVAETPVVAIRIFKPSFDRVVAEDPRVAAKILAVVARRLREAERTLNS